MSFGVLPTGYNRKPLAVILSELEEAFIAEFGPNVIQTPQSPLGQINGLLADAFTEHWETTEDVYQSMDIDQATGPRLETLAKLRYLKRIEGESVDDFRARITNEGQADIKLATNVQRLLKLDGVTWAHAIENAKSTVSELGMPPNSVAYAVTSGEDVEVGALVYQMALPGIELYGNYQTSIVVDDYCQQAIFIRPAEIPIKVEVDVSHVPDPCNCAPPNISTLQAHLIAYYAGKCGYKNGDTVTSRQIHAVASQVAGIKVEDVRIARQPNSLVLPELPMTIFERAVIKAPFVEVRYVDPVP